MATPIVATRLLAQVVRITAIHRASQITSASQPDRSRPKPRGELEDLIATERAAGRL